MVLFRNMLFSAIVVLWMAVTLSAAAAPADSLPASVNSTGAPPSAPPTASVGGISVSTGTVVATVSIDSVVVGTTPLKRDSIPVGTHALRIAAQGYATVTEPVLIAAGQVLTREIIFDPCRDGKNSGKEDVDSVRAASQSRFTLALNSSKNIDNLEKMMDALLSGATFDSASTVAVLPFAVAPGVQPRVGIMAAEYAVVNMSARKGIKIVERDGFEKMMQELALSQSDVVPEAKALAAGKILAARYLVLGNVTEDQGKRLVTVRIVETETGTVVSAAAASIRIRDMDAFTHDALGEKVDPYAALFRSTVLPGWGQFYTGHPGQGIAAMACALGGAGALIWSVIDWSNKRTQADLFRRQDHSTYVVGQTSEEEWLAAGNAKIIAQNKAVTRDYYIGGALGAIWIVNMADAFLCGIIESRHVKARYFSVVPTFDGRNAGCALSLNIVNSKRSK
jgi:TolB-like protein